MHLLAASATSIRFMAVDQRRNRTAECSTSIEGLPEMLVDYVYTLYCLIRALLEFASQIADFDRYLPFAFLFGRCRACRPVCLALPVLVSA
jgi:hypothetical protein